MHSIILMDLDGTITDPKEGITRSVRIALRRFGIEEQDSKRLEAFIGPPLLESFQVFYGMDQEQACRALTAYREYFADRGIFENRVYDGMERMLARWTAAGFTLMVATSKPTVFARRILDHFGLARYFSFVGGSELDGARTAKGDVIRYVLEHEGVNPAAAVMVGDRKHDILGARQAGIASVGVLYGYGSREELEQAGAGRIAATVEELSDLLMEETDSKAGRKPS